MGLSVYKTKLIKVELSPSLNIKKGVTAYF